MKIKERVKRKGFEMMMMNENSNVHIKNVSHVKKSNPHISLCNSFPSNGKGNNTKKGESCYKAYTLYE